MRLTLRVLIGINLKKLPKVASILGAKIIRSYVPLTDKNKKVKHASDGAYDDSKITARFDKED